MFEKVNPSHPDKIADRIAGAIVDIAYETQIDPKVAVEVLIGHGICHAIVETSAMLNPKKVKNAILDGEIENTFEAADAYMRARAAEMGMFPVK